MYKIKSKPGFNVVIKDLGIALRSETKDWITVSKEAFDNSKDAKSVMKYIIVEGVEAVQEQVSAVADSAVKQTAEGAFVRDGHLQKNPDDVFVATPSTSIEALTRTVIQDEPTPTFVAQPPVDETPAPEQAPTFVAEPAEIKEPVAEAKAVEAETQKTESKPAKKSGSKSKASGEKK